MKAAIRKGYFWWSSYSFTNNCSRPKLPSSPSNFLLIKVNAAAINPVDYKLPRPLIGEIFGLDFCGTVVEVGSEDCAFKVGDVVFGRGYEGTLAEYCIADASEVAALPKANGEYSLTCDEAAALPVAYITAITGWRRVGILPSDSAARPNSIVIIGASGGCGLAATQLANGLGIPRIVGICSSKNANFVIEKGGATEVVDYTDENALRNFLEENAGKIDHVYDTATCSGGGEDYRLTGLELLSKNGSYVVLNGSVFNFLRFALPGGSGFSDPRQTLHFPKFETRDLEAVVELLTKAKLKPEVEVMEFSSDGCEAGLTKLKGRRTRGKIVFHISDMSAQK